VDPVTAYSSPGANFNRYWYANNNPYRFFDPDGRLTSTIDDGYQKREVQEVAAQKSLEGSESTLMKAVATQLGEAVSNKENIEVAAKGVSSDIANGVGALLKTAETAAVCPTTCAFKEIVGESATAALENVGKEMAVKEGERQLPKMAHGEKILKVFKIYDVISTITSTYVCTQGCFYDSNKGSKQ
jgi:hypothetical protein